MKNFIHSVSKRFACGSIFYGSSQGKPLFYDYKDERWLQMNKGSCLVNLFFHFTTQKFKVMKSHIRNMSNKIKIGAFIFMFLAIWDLEIKAQSNKQTGKGAVIVADFTQPVSFIDQAGKKINFGNELRGSIITEGQTAEVGKGGKLVLLFSNGTITTLQSETR